MAKVIKAKFVAEKETKGTIRYEEQTYFGLGAQYIPKHVIYTALGKAEWPKEIEVDIKLPEE